MLKGSREVFLEDFVAFLVSVIVGRQKSRSVHGQRHSIDFEEMLATLCLHPADSIFF
jgi:hypothetical protein